MVTLHIPRSVTLHIIVVSESHSLSHHFFLPIIHKSLLAVYLNVDNAGFTFMPHS